MKIQHFFEFSLRTITQVIALISAVFSLFVMGVLFHEGPYSYAMIKNAQKERQKLQEAGGASGFSIALYYTFFQAILELLTNGVLYYGTLVENSACIRLWIRHSCFCLCSQPITISYISLLLFLAEAPATGAAVMFTLFIFFPAKLYSTIVVHSYDASIAPTLLLVQGRNSTPGWKPAEEKP